MILFILRKASEKEKIKLGDTYLYYWCFSQKGGL